DFGDFQIAGASPESLVKVSGRRVEQRPIAGTRPRAGTAEERPIAGTRPRADKAEEDLARAGELLADEKERAEHVMLVDLGRNVLGRVCRYGSVRVDELMVVESYSHVMHIVSSVSGELADGVTPMDALRASLPAGTLSGAPKIRAMQIIDDLEPSGRGPYGGAIGYLSFTGDLDTCIYIRSALVKDGRVHAQAGGGIVADSDPGYEVRETEAKAGAVFEAVALACRQPDWA
ncbi:MAG TPA: anthranilate synthase component I family protein, partial [Thermoleophilaceae bacterium]